MARRAMLAIVILASLTSTSVLSQECRKSVNGGGYSGSVSETGSGITCQRWDSQDPHSHSFTDPRMFPDDTMDDVANNCRNPDMEPSGPWCYTTDSGVRWDYCDVDFCSLYPECKVTDNGTEYRGPLSQTQSGEDCYPSDAYCRNPDVNPGGPWCYTDDEDNWDFCDVPVCKVSSSCKSTQQGQEYVGTVSTTANGRPCQRWDKQFPHSHGHTDPDEFPDDTLEGANNHCRNPDGSSEGVWCYTQDPNVQREYCDVNLCQDCKVTDQGKEYAGTLSETESGETCQRWDSQSPHPHDQTDINRYPDASLEDAANYCRNPDCTPGGPWCYTTNPDTEWEFCDMPYCHGCEDDTPLRKRVRHVVHMGLDGFHPCFVDAPGGAPNIMRLADEGTYTISGARTVLESVSGPSWMATQVGSDTESTGVTSNGWKPPWKGYSQSITPVTGLDIPFPTVYRVLKSQDINIRTASFYDWDWHHNIQDYGDPGSLDRDSYCHPGSNGGTFACDGFIANNASEYLREALFAAESTYTFVYMDSLDGAGHGSGWCTDDYLDQVDLVDELVGVVLDTLDDVNMADEVLVMLSSDHGGLGTGHGCYNDECIQIPMFLRGPGIRENHEFVHGVRNGDMVPTALYAMGFKQNPWTTGVPMYEAFDD